MVIGSSPPTKYNTDLRKLAVSYGKLKSITVLLRYCGKVNCPPVTTLSFSRRLIQFNQLSQSDLRICFIKEVCSEYQCINTSQTIRLSNVRKYLDIFAFYSLLFFICACNSFILLSIFTYFGKNDALR